MKSILTTLVFLIGCIFPVYAQQDSITVFVDVIDAFTGGIVEEGEVDVMRPDSTFMHKGRWTYSVDDNVRTESSVSVKVPHKGKYLLRITHPDYMTEWVPINVNPLKRSNSWIILSDKIALRRRARKLKEETTLGEAVVSVTKIKMVMKKDTIVYNADAFQLSQGSMLDALIEQLPGAELSESGLITVNGKPISSLLVNGKDFFRGDPKIALDNLPAYMVDKVKVYEQKTEFEELTGKKESVRPLVMDVNLKKQYSAGWLANAEAAYGTQERYLGRAFALRFTDCSRLAIFGNANNTNDTRRPGARGDWSPSYLPDGEQESQTAGVEYAYEDRKKTFEWVSNLNASHAKNVLINSTEGEQFIPGEKVFNLSRRDNRSHAASLETSHRFNIKKKVRQSGSIHASYHKNRANSQSQAGEFAGNPYVRISRGMLDSLFIPGGSRLADLARYRRSQQAKNRSESWSIQLPYSLRTSLLGSRGIGDMLSFNVSGGYDQYKSYAFDHYKLEYFPLATNRTDYRNRYKDYHSRHYFYNGDLSYYIQLDPIWINLSYGYSEDYRKGRNDLFRLDRLEDWGSDSNHPIGSLPSAQNEMQQALDEQNSEHSEQRKRSHQVSLRLEYRSKKTNRTTLVAYLPLRIESDWLVYNRARQTFDLQRTKPLFMPTLSLQQILSKDEAIERYTNLVFQYNLVPSLPGIINRIELVNDANPLYIQHGNPHLKTSITHNLSFDISTSRQYRSLYNLHLGYQRTHHAFATARTYNSATGGYSVRPVNVNGNWRTDGRLTLNRQFGKQKQFTWDNQTSFSFDHNIDMSNIDGETINTLSTVKSLYLREQFRIGYSHKGWHLSAKLQGSYNRLTGDRQDFNTITAWDYSYGVSARIPLPWKFGLSTDLTVFSRRGYNDPSLNTDNVVWNARLERSILNGNLTFMIDGFDLLKNLSKVTRTVNAQGRTESYSNVIPSYFMAHIVYRLNVQPKKRAK